MNVKKNPKFSASSAVKTQRLGWHLIWEDGHSSFVPSREDAYLMAAAPDLYAVCEAIDALDTYGISLPRGFIAIRDAARAALAKARGEGGSANV